MAASDPALRRWGLLRQPTPHHAQAETSAGPTAPLLPSHFREGYIRQNRRFRRFPKPLQPNTTAAAFQHPQVSSGRKDWPIFAPDRVQFEALKDRKKAAPH